jgi:hypothetical protein
MKRSVVSAIAPVLAAVMAIGTLLLSSTAVHAANLTCANTTQTGGTVNNVTVPGGKHCTLDGVRVTGDVIVQSGASLRVTNVFADTTIAGDIKANDCLEVRLENGDEPFSPYRIIVAGNVTITKCDDGVAVRGDPTRTAPPSILIGGNLTCSNSPGHEGCGINRASIGGNIVCSGNSASCSLQSNAIGGNVTLNNNAIPGIRLTNNAIGGNLACSGNASATGGPTPNNTVAGTKSGQCAAL